MGLAVCMGCQPKSDVRAGPASIEQHSSGQNVEEAMAEDSIRQRVDDLARSVSGRDIDGVMSLYAPQLVSFDVDPPLRYAGTANKRRAWQAFFAAHDGPITYRVRELQVTAAGDLAFAYSVNHVSGTLVNGNVSDLWVRWTACFRRLNGVWLIVHDHASVPADLKNGHAVLDLTP